MCIHTHITLSLTSQTPERQNVYITRKVIWLLTDYRALFPGCSLQAHVYLANIDVEKNGYVETREKNHVISLFIPSI